MGLTVALTKIDMGFLRSGVWHRVRTSLCGLWLGCTRCDLKRGAVSQQAQPRRRWITTADAARELHMHPNTVRNRIKRGEIPSRQEERGGRRVYLIPESYVERVRRSGKPSKGARDSQNVAHEVSKRVVGDVETLLEERGPELTGLSERDETIKRLRLERDEAMARLEELEGEVVQSRRLIWILTGLLARRN